MKFISRAEWGARPPRDRDGIGRPYGTTIHWGGGSLGDHSHARCYAVVRSWQNYHMDSHGWDDIGYNGVPCHHGYVFEGRGTGVRGAHAGESGIGGNEHWYGLCAMVGPGDTITPELLDALRDGIAWFRDEGGAGNRVNGHRDHHPTECPGDGLYGWAHGAHVGGGDSAGPGKYLDLGDASPAVKQWQDDLLEWNPDALPEFGADGDFGEETEKWTRRFQEYAGVTVDGVVGPQTRQAMEEELDMPSAKEVAKETVDELLSRDVIEVPWPSKNKQRTVKHALEYILDNAWKGHVHAREMHPVLTEIAKREGVEVKALAAELLPGLLAAVDTEYAETIADAIDDDLARRLADVLAARLAG